MSVDELLAEAGLPQTAREPEGSDDLRRQLAEVQGELVRQRALATEVQGRLDELAARFDDRVPAAVDRGTRDTLTLEGLLGVMADLEQQVAEVGAQLGRRWESPFDYDESASPADSLKQRVGTLEARTAEVAGMVGAPYGGYPSAPSSSDDQDRSLRAWLAQVIQLLQEQLAVVQQHTRNRIAAADDARGAGRGG